MSSDNSYHRIKRVLVFTTILIVIAGISIGMVAVFLEKPKNRPDTKTVTKKLPTLNSGLLNILTSNEVIAKHFAALRILDENYGVLLTGTNNQERLDSVYKLIDVQEELMRISLDSLALNNSELANGEYTRVIDEIIVNYRSILRDRNSLNRLRNLIKLGEHELSPSDMTILQNQDQLKELNEKTSRIKTLEAMLQALSVKKSEPIQITNTGTSEEVARLRESITQQQRRMDILSSANAGLKQENDKLVKQQSDVARSTVSGESTVNSRISTLQQKIDVLNSELSLARVDCNLSRVDAAQIISNSKQRRQLLSEASGILTNLSNVADVSVKKKVQDKIALLNRVAASSRD